MPVAELIRERQRQSEELEIAARTERHDRVSRTILRFEPVPVLVREFTEVFLGRSALLMEDAHLSPGWKAYLEGKGVPVEASDSFFLHDRRDIRSGVLAVRAPHGGQDTDRNALLCDSLRRWLKTAGRNGADVQVIPLGDDALPRTRAGMRPACILMWRAEQPLLERFVARKAGVRLPDVDQPVSNGRPTVINTSYAPEAVPTPPEPVRGRLRYRVLGETRGVAGRRFFVSKTGGILRIAMLAQQKLSDESVVEFFDEVTGEGDMLESHRNRIRSRRPDEATVSFELGRGGAFRMIAWQTQPIYYRHALGKFVNVPTCGSAADGAIRIRTVKGKLVAGDALLLLPDTLTSRDRAELSQLFATSANGEREKLLAQWLDAHSRGRALLIAHG